MLTLYCPGAAVVYRTSEASATGDLGRRSRNRSGWRMEPERRSLGARSPSGVAGRALAASLRHASEVSRCGKISHVRSFPRGRGKQRPGRARSQFLFGVRAKRALGNWMPPLPRSHRCHLEKPEGSRGARPLRLLLLLSVICCGAPRLGLRARARARASAPADGLTKWQCPVALGGAGAGRRA